MSGDNDNVIDRTENPIIWCTEKELAWDAWLHARQDDSVRDSSSDPDFIIWWDDTLKRSNNGAEIVSIRALCLSAWKTSNKVETDNQTDNRFAAWWQTILDSQPTTTT